MFSELDTKGPRLRRGSIEVVCGSMFSGKTEELIRRMKRAQFAKLKVEIFKPAIDVRYSEAEVVSHDRNAIQSTPVDSSQNILLMANDVDVVGIDEAQFFDMGIVEVANELARRGIRVICAGLDMDHHKNFMHGFGLLRSCYRINRTSFKAYLPPSNRF